MDRKGTPPMNFAEVPEKVMGDLSLGNVGNEDQIPSPLLNGPGAHLNADAGLVGLAVVIDHHYVRLSGGFGGVDRLGELYALDMLQDRVPNEQANGFSPAVDYDVDLYIKARHPRCLLDILPKYVSLKFAGTPEIPRCFQKGSMVEGYGFHAGYPWQENLPPTPVSAEPVRADATDADPQVTGHHLAVDGQWGAEPRLPEKGTIAEWVMVIHREALRNLPAQFFSEIDVGVRAVGTQGRDEPDSFVPDPRLLQLLEDEGQDLRCSCGAG